MKMNVNKEYELGSESEKGDKERFLSSFFKLMAVQGRANMPSVHHETGLL
jgi:hypothetical protein